MTHTHFGHPRPLHLMTAGLVLSAALSGCSGSEGSTTESPVPSTAVTGGSAAKLLEKALKEQGAGQTAQAKADYEALVAMDPKNKLGYYNLGLIAQLAGQDTVAVDNYEKTLGIDPKYGPALYNLAILKNKLGDPTAAEDLYRRAIAANPKDANAHFNLGPLL